MRSRSSGGTVSPVIGFIEPCIPTVAKAAPSGDEWIHEIKFDGYRLVVRKDEDRVRVFTRRGADWTKRFPRIVAAVRELKVDSALIDGEGIVYDAKGMPSFDLIHSHEHDNEASLLAFDLLELNGTPVSKQPLVERKELLADVLAKGKAGIEFNEHIEGHGHLIFEHVCKLGHEGIVAKRRDLPYESGRSRRWLKIKNPNSAAMRRVKDGTF